jgi:hypothetical protein
MPPARPWARDDGPVVRAESRVSDSTTPGRLSVDASSRVTAVASPSYEGGRPGSVGCGSLARWTGDSDTVGSTREIGARGAAAAAGAS